MEHTRLVFFETPKANLKITKIYENTELLESIAAEASDKTSMSHVSEYYTTPVCFPAAPAKRPYVTSSIALSADGKMAFNDNKAGPLVAKNNYLDPDGALGDFWVLNLLRAYADGVVFAGNTMKNEPGVSSHVYDVDLNRQRNEELGKIHHPVGVCISLDGTDIPFDHHSINVDPVDEYKVVFGTSPDGGKYILENSPLKHVVYGPFNSMEDVDNWEVPELYCDYDVKPIIITGEGSMPNTEVFLYVLRKLGLENICIESPTYTSHLMRQGWLDEYFINYSMLYAGGVMTPGYSNPSSYLDHVHANLVSVGIHQSNFLFTRQKLVHGVKCQQSLEGYKY